MIDINELQKLTTTMSILYVEDDLEVQNNTKGIFEDLFDQVEVANDGSEGLEKYKKNKYDIVITDINMPNMNGIELIGEIKKININQAVIIISAHNETEHFINGIEKGIDGYILKPLNYDQLFDILLKVTSIVNLNKENKEYKLHMQTLVEEKTKKIEENYQKMQNILTTDKITGLPNANLLYQYFDLYPEKKLTVILLRIDNFNFLSQAYSSTTCDEIVRNIAKFIQINLPPKYVLYKYSDEEFIILSHEVEKNYPIELVTQMRVFFRETPVLQSKDNKDIFITLSSALVINEPSLNILQKANATLNEFYRVGTIGDFKVYKEDSYFIKELKNENYWFERIREIIEHDKLIPFFHPIVCNQTEKILRYECLVRADDDGTIISPVHFLESVRKTGLMTYLSKIMVNKCFSFFSNTDISFTINITNEDLLSNDFIDFILYKQKQYNIEPRLVVFEILEDIIFDSHNEISIKNLVKLKEHGFLLALDDFGSDRSNFNRFISILNLDFLKIDGQFITNIDKNKKNYNIVKSIVSLAKQLNIKLVAEFVSTKEEFEVVKNLGIESSQGYYFFKPDRNI